MPYNFFQDPFGIRQAKDTQNYLTTKQDNLTAARPEEVIPQAATDAFNLAKSFAKADMPGYSQAKNDILSSTAQGIKNVGKVSNSVAGTIGGTADIYGNEVKSMAGLDVAQEQYKQSKQEGLIQANEKMADWQQTKENWDVLSKYREQNNALTSKIQNANADKNQGMQNMFGLFQSLIGAGGNAAKIMATGGTSAIPTGGR
jgi:hypothetical protein